MALSRIVSDVLRSAAPTLLTALAIPPPFNLIAAAVASTALRQFSPGGQTASAVTPSGSVSTGAAAAKVLTPEDVVRIVEQNSTSPQLLLSLTQAENDLRKYELDTGLKFAELAIKDRARAGDFQSSANIAPLVFKAGMWLVGIAIFGMLVMVGALVLLASGYFKLDTNSQFSVAAFGLIGTVVGFINGIAGTVVSFYWGSSQGSKEKSDAMVASMIDLAEARSVPTYSPPPVPPPSIPATQPVVAADPTIAGPVSTGVTPARITLLAELFKELTTPHKVYPESVDWCLTATGISIEGAAAVGSAGKPATVRDIWSKYGELCIRSAKQYGVPIELIVATIATESSGKPDVRRAEPKIRDESVGLMQTLVGTARDALGRQSINGDDLLDPALSINAGTAYIAKQRGNTHFDAPLVAAAYNAGSLRKDAAEANRWRLLCYPTGTGNHIDKFVTWFADAMRVSADENWARSPDIPSLAALFGQASGQPRTVQPVPSAATDAAALTGDKQIQQMLSDLGYLDPPPDGDFGPVSKWALAVYCARNGIAYDGGPIPTGIQTALGDPARALPPLPRTEAWLDRVIDFMASRKYWICRYPDCKNIVYLEGTSIDGTLNANAPNAFNDVRLVFWIDNRGSLKAKAWEATSEPGRFWTLNPMDDRGAARIAFGQYKAWRVGTHRAGTPSAHEALVQVDPLRVYRDLNKDYLRQGDKIYEGLFGINQHWGYDNDQLDLGKSSAGCLVGRSTDGHREFMKLLKADPRYIASNGYRFMTTVMDGREVLG
ncbi:peptidoglycan-binding protein [Rhizobium cauense]|uniref:peptidoglycan-binding protein n=1 Tax=Rhizobium cauense TaxID=1166683 RepID=UPI001C6E763D|nr:peptidoglycan-binding protein [Rhizobium cauense]MBW9114656.1 peptidoglycan-binding protein [Rhizobium cauense]